MDSCRRASGAYPLVGEINTSPETGQAIGFVVVWQNEKKNSNSVTAWSGQLQLVNDEEVITTTWLLTQETDQEDDWESTLVGKDIFTRYPPIERSKKNIAKSYPKKIK